eukprot:s1456_g9.t1
MRAKRAPWKTSAVGQSWRESGQRYLQIAPWLQCPALFVVMSLTKSPPQANEDDSLMQLFVPNILKEFLVMRRLPAVVRVFDYSVHLSPDGYLLRRCQKELPLVAALMNSGGILSLTSDALSHVLDEAGSSLRKSATKTQKIRTVFFGPNMVNGMVDESVLDYYVVLPVDDCGHIPKDATVLGQVAKSSTPAICCEENKYQITINQPNFAYNKIMVVPAGATYASNFLDDGWVLS